MMELTERTLDLVKTRIAAVAVIKAAKAYVRQGRSCIDYNEAMLRQALEGYFDQISDTFMDAFDGYRDLFVMLDSPAPYEAKVKYVSDNLCLIETDAYELQRIVDEEA